MDQPYEFKEDAPPLRLNYTSSGQGSPEGRRPDSARSMRSSGSQNPMLDIKNSRKRTEADLQMLANRIALLRTEEERAKVKVAETKQRANDIQRLKKRNKAVQDQALQAKLEKELKEKELREKVKKEKRIRQTKVEVTRKIIAESRKEEAERLKVTIRSQMNESASGREQQEQVNRAKAAAERARREEVKQRREREKEKKEREIQRRYEKQLELERQKAEEAQALIEKMEREEAELIENLKATQKQQEEAYAKLQRSLENDIV